MWSSLLSLFGLSVACLSKNVESMNAMELLTAYGNPGENHKVVTQDGYILDIHRLQLRTPNRKPPVLFQHGITVMSDIWVLMGPKRDLAFLLWEEGYDIWLSNIRGTPYSQHVNKTREERSFWEYSFHEMGYYDVPAVIDYILNLTQKPDLYYIGHSMGTTISYVLCATRPEYNNKIRAVFSLAPTAYMYNVSNWFKQVSIWYMHMFYGLFMSEKLYELFPSTKEIGQIAADHCKEGSPMLPICLKIISLIYGDDKMQLNKTMLPISMKHVCSTSANTVMHYAQHIRTGDFRWYDHGKKQNIRIYGMRKPPKYNLSLITAPVVLYYSNNDFISTEQDVNRLASQLPNLRGKVLVPFKYFNHIDYLFGKDGKKLLYNDILNRMREML